MASTSKPPTPRVNGNSDKRSSPDDDPITPQDDILPPQSSQITLPSTEDPGSPRDPNGSFKTEVNDDGAADAVIPSSLTPPPSSQVPANSANPSSAVPYIGSQRSLLFSPPTTGTNATRRDVTLVPEYVVPSPRQVLAASADELRAMMQSSIAEQSRLKTEALHYKLQFQLLNLQASEDAQRQAVEHDMTRREVETLRMAEHVRQARRELDSVADSTYSKLIELRMRFDEEAGEKEVLEKKLKLAKKVIQQKEDEISYLRDQNDQLLTRIRENREHFNMLRSPGGILYGALTPKQTVSTPQQNKGTARLAPKSQRDHTGEPLAYLLHALNQENTSAPSTPTTLNRSQPRAPPKHTRNVQSLSSLPTTPTSRTRELLPSLDVLPQTEPVRRFSSKQFGHRQRNSVGDRDRRSRESTISVPDNEELARQALESVQKASSFLSRASGASLGSQRRAGDEEEEEVPQSQASAQASEMLRRDPRESFEVASSVDSRDRTPPPGDKMSGIQAKQFLNASKTGPEKRKFSGGDGGPEVFRRELPSPPKKLRVGGPLGETPRVGLGINYTQ